MMAVRPYRWHLTRIAAAELRLCDSLAQLLPGAAIQSAVQHAIQQSCAKHLGGEFQLALATVATTTFDTWVRGLPPSCIVAACGLHPLPQHGFLQIDPRLAGAMIAKLLGEETGGVAPVELHPPTETEQGVLQYLIMQCSAAIHAACGAAERVHFRFERLYLRPDELPAIASATVCGVLSWRIGWGDLTGVVHLCVPQPWLDAIVLKPMTLPPTLVEEERRLEQDHLRQFDWLRTSCWVEAGVTELTSAEMAGLEPGDVVVMDQCDLELVERRPRGEVVMRVGPGREVGVRAKILDGKSFGVQLLRRES